MWIDDVENHKEFIKSNNLEARFRKYLQTTNMYLQKKLTRLH